MRDLIASLAGVAAVMAVILLVLLASTARAQINPTTPAERSLRALETTATAETAQANIQVAIMQTLQALVVANHAQACLMASEQMGSWYTRVYRRAEMAWKSLNCQAFFEATSEAQKQKAVEEAQ